MHEQAIIPKVYMRTAHLVWGRGGGVGMTISVQPIGKRTRTRGLPLPPLFRERERERVTFIGSCIDHLLITCCVKSA